MWLRSNELYVNVARNTDLTCLICNAFPFPSSSDYDPI